MGCLVTAWVIALTDGSRLRKCIPERTSLVPSGAHKDKTVPATADTYQGLGSRLGV